MVSRLSPLTVSLEWRHQRWWRGGERQRTLDWQREMNVVNTIVDAPQGFDNTVPAVWAATYENLALVRLHGRNAATWNHKGARSSGRFMYDYSDAELAALATNIERLSRTIARTHVVLNTNHEDQGVRNAQRLAQALGIGAGHPPQR